MEKFFNTTGPCYPSRHYMLPATARIPDIMRLVEREQYFALHAAPSAQPMSWWPSA